MDEARATRLAAVFVRRLRGAPEIWTACQSSGAVDRNLVRAVIAVEISARGALWRRTEWLVATGLIAIGAGKRASAISVGPAQIQPRQIGKQATRSVLRDLMAAPSACIECCDLLNALIDSIGLTPKAPGTWNRKDWRAMGLAYNGSADYGDVLAAVHRILSRKSQLGIV